MMPHLNFRWYTTLIQTRIEQAQKKVGSELQISINATSYMIILQPPKYGYGYQICELSSCLPGPERLDLQPAAQNTADSRR